jgi:predicted dienelactone hydrolase
VPDAGHFAFVACSAEMAKRAAAICRDGPGFDREAFQQKFNAAVVGFFKARLL